MVRKDTKESRYFTYLVVASRYDHNYQSVRSFFEVFRPFPIFSKKQAMGRKYTFKDHDRACFVTFTVIHWLDVYIREIYRDIFYDSVSFCQREKGFEVYAYCIMTSHYPHDLIQRLNYIHNNPVVAGFVEEPTAWLHSSARDYAGEGKVGLN